MINIQENKKLNISSNKTSINKGFTLVEMVVVLVMLAIAMTLTVFGVLAWQDWADFNRQNEYAETLFVAAQNQLAEYSANGRLQEMKASLYGFDSVEEYKLATEDTDTPLTIGEGGRPTSAIELNVEKLHKIKNGEGIFYNEENIWPEAYRQTQNQVNYTDVIVSLRAEAGQYEKYLNNPEALKKEDLDAYWVFEILGDYVYDTTILGGTKDNGVAICLEITVNNGQVFSALYSDKNDYFRYESFESKIEANNRCGDISDRAEAVRQDNMVGYYGVDTLYAATPTDIERPGISSIALVDDNYFYLKMRLSERYRDRTSQLNYTIDLNGSKNQADKVMTISFNGAQLKNVASTCDTLAACADYSLNAPDHGTITGNVTIYGDDRATAVSNKEFQFIGWVDSDYYIHLILDAADMQAETELYNSEFASILTNDRDLYFDKTFSYFRFGTPIENLWVSAFVDGEGVSKSKTVSNFGNTNFAKNQPGTNPVYQSKREFIQAGKLNIVYEISNPRHMYNIRYNSDVSMDTRKARKDFKFEKTLYEPETVNAITYDIKNDIDWSLFQSAGYLMNGYGNTKLYDDIDRFNCKYPSYAKMNLKDVIEGNHFVISGINIDKASNQKYGCTEDLSPKTEIKEGDEYFSSVVTNYPTGLVNVNYGTIKNLKLDNVMVVGDSMVGAFVGVNVGDIERLSTVKNVKSKVEGVKNVGGIIGFEIPTSEDTIIQFCENNISVTGQEAVGGIVGMVRNEFSNIISGVNIDDNPILKGAKDSVAILNMLNASGIEKLKITINKCDNYGPVQGEYKQMYQVVGKKESDSSQNADSAFYVKDTVLNSGNTKLYINVYNNSLVQLKISKIEIELDKPLNKSGADSGGSKVIISSDKKNITIEPKNADANILSKQGKDIRFDIHFKDGEENTFKIKAIKIFYTNGAGSSYASGHETPSFVNKDIAQNSSSENIVKDITKVTGDDKNIRYLGGIVGYCYNQFDDTKKINIKDCTSCPQYEDSWLFGVLGDDTRLGDYLKGYYVGGIVGYNHYGEIQACSSKSTKVDHGYIFGDEFVGGIAGLNIGPASGIAGGTSIKQGGNANNVIANKYAGGIVGCNAYVKDIDSDNRPLDIVSGRIQADPEKLIGILVPDTKTSLNVKIANWLNEGIVIAKDSYAGGISGYNAGWIYACNTKITETDANNYFTKLYTDKYAGGITGYNNGIVGNTDRTIEADGQSSKKKTTAGETLSIRSYVKGNNYVGGIVGYNDVDAIVEDYKVAGGHVYGEKSGCFIGGYAGFNAAIDLLMDTESGKPRSIKSSPNNVEGGYFVGGIIGGNIIDTNGYKTIAGADGNLVDSSYLPNTISGDIAPGNNKIEAQFETDNFLGTLTGEAYVGGFVGYSMLVDAAAVEADMASLAEGDRGLVYLLQDNLVKEINTVTSGVDAEDKKLHDISRYLDEFQDKFIEDNSSLANKSISSNVIIHMTGVNKHTRNSLGAIKAKIYVGGVAGYVDGNTALYVEHVENATPIVATSAIEYMEQQPLYELQEDGSYKKAEDKYRSLNYAGMPFLYKYSYAGGIVGKVGAKTTIDACANVSLGRVSSTGTYTGGICEVNEGVIKNCSVTNLGDGATDYVGGICGLNLNKITTCSVVDKTITGRNMVAAITAENFGIVENIELKNAKIMTYSNAVSHNGADGTIFNSYDGVSGLFAAYNGNIGIISLEKDITDVTVQSKGRYVGLAVGFNEGSISNNKAGVSTPELAHGNKADYISICENNLKISGTIEGYMTVGALIGCNNDKGKNHTIHNYTNLATVKASYGEAGGIIGVNSSNNTMAYCINNALVVATDGGNAGGITSVNAGEITRCFDYKTISAPNGMCGGIVALNDKNGNIYECFIEPENLSANKDSTITFSSTQVVGGLAAQNAGTVSNNYLMNITITNDTTKTYTKMGALVGENLESGTILISDLSKSSNTIDNAEIKNCKVVVESNNCRVGGIAGTNAGTIKGTAIKTNDKSKVTIGEYQIMSLVTCDLQLKGATYAAMGGVAGINTGTIKDISVDAKIKGILGTEDSGYGGIAGVNGVVKSGNGKSAIISNCTFDGYINASGSGGMLARIGGIAGINGYNSKIEYCGLGVRTDAGSSNETEISAGDTSKGSKADTTDIESSSYTGGIVGENYGQITDIDGVSSTKDNKVNIIAFAGSTGGIVGHNCPGAVVSGYVKKNGGKEEIHRISTGDKWSVEMRCAENNRGPGGVIGLNESGKEIRYVDNYTYVLGSYQANMKTGGFIGENMQIESHQLHFTNCNNFAKIDGWANTGGFIGHDWFRGTVFKDCSNYGTIKIISSSNAKQRFAGGFIGRITAVETGFSFVNCENHGNVWTNHKDSADCCAGGFIGQVDALPSYVTSYMSNCVNTGIISRLSNGTKLLGGFIGDCRSIWVLDLCRNYNTYKTDSGFSAKGKEGINFYIRNSLDVSLQTTTTALTAPFGGMYTTAGSYNNYYIAAKELVGTDGSITYLGSDYDTDGDLRVEFIPKDSLQPVIALRNNDPLATNKVYFNDKSELSTARSETPGIAYVKWDENGRADVYSDTTDSRISVYKELDTAFVEYILGSKKIEEKLSMPKNLEIYMDKGYVNASWSQVTTTVDETKAEPYGYEVSYIIYDNLDNPVTEEIRDIQSADNKEPEVWHYPLSVEQEWIEKNYHIKIKVRAINAYHFMEEGDDTLDSAWTEPVKYVFDGGQLIMPEVHIELTAGNKMVAVLDNLEEFEMHQFMYTDENGDEVPISMAEACTIELSWYSDIADDDGKGFKFVIEPDSSFVSNATAYVGSDALRRLHATAVPKEEYRDRLLDSVTYFVSGNGYSNGTLVNKNSYADTDIFFGFVGEDASSMTYKIGMKKGDDSYITTDIGAYDEEIGTYVYHGRELTHLGSSAGGDVTLISTLKNLPQEWFENDAVSSFEARTYIDSAQNKVIHYGHEVVSGINLYHASESMNAIQAREANINELKSIRDSYYFKKVPNSAYNKVDNRADFLETNVPIWDDDKNDLKYGYVLYENEDGTYDIIYNATIELSRVNGDSFTTSHSGDGDQNDSRSVSVDRKYYKYAVDVMTYDSRSNNDEINTYVGNNILIPHNSKVNLGDYEQSYLLRRQNYDNMVKTAAGQVIVSGYPFYNNTKVTTNSTVYNQNIMPLPIVEKDSEGNEVTISEVNGKKEYTISWDKFYRDSVTNDDYSYATNPDGSLAVKAGAAGEIVYYTDASGNKYYFNSDDNNYYKFDKETLRPIVKTSTGFVSASNEDTFYGLENEKYYYFEKAKKNIYEIDSEGLLVDFGNDYIYLDGDYYYTETANTFFDVNSKQFMAVDINNLKAPIKYVEGLYHYSVKDRAFWDEDSKSYYYYNSVPVVFKETDEQKNVINNGTTMIKTGESTYRYTNKSNCFYDYEREAFYYPDKTPKLLIELVEDKNYRQTDKNYIYYDGEYHYSLSDRSFYNAEKNTLYYFESVPVPISEINDEGKLVVSDKYYLYRDGTYYYTTEKTRVIFDEATKTFYKFGNEPKTEIVYHNGKYYYSTTVGATFDATVDGGKFTKNGTTKNVTTLQATILDANKSKVAKPVPDANNKIAIKIPTGNDLLALAGDTVATVGKTYKASDKYNISATKITGIPAGISSDAYNVWWNVVPTFNAGMYINSELSYLAMAGQEVKGLDGNRFTLPDCETWKAFRQSTAIYDDFIDNLTNQKSEDEERRNYCLGIMNAYYMGYSTASYKVELIGHTDTGAEVVLDTKYVDSPTAGDVENYAYVIEYKNNGSSTGKTQTRYASYETMGYETTFVDNSSSWEKYKRISVRIMRLGQDRNFSGINANNLSMYGVTTSLGQKIGASSEYSAVMLPRYTTVSVVQKQRLNTVDTPIASMTQTEDGKFITDYPSYDISWMLNKEAEQLKDLAGYLIKIEDASSEGTLPKTYYYIAENSAYKPDYNSLAISSNELEYLVKNVTNIEAIKDADERVGTVSLNFIDYAGRNVNVSVRAMTRENSEENPRMYLNGYESQAIDISVKDSLVVPDVSLLKLAISDASGKTDSVVTAKDTEKAGMPDYDNAKTTIGEGAAAETFEHAVSSDLYEKGFTFNYAAISDDSVSANYAKDNEHDVKLSLAIAIYDSVSDDMIKDMSKINAGDAVSSDSVSGNECWNSGAIVTLYSKSSPFSYGLVRLDSAADTETNLSIKSFEKYSGLYAGKWMKIAIKATSESNIDSVWSDEDLADKSVNYVWIHIPKFALKDVDISADYVNRWYGEKEVESGSFVPIIDINKKPYTEKQFAYRTLKFKDDQNADGWHIGIYEKELLEAIAPSKSAAMFFSVQESTENTTENETPLEDRELEATPDSDGLDDSDNLDDEELPEETEDVNPGDVNSEEVNSEDSGSGDVNSEEVNSEDVNSEDSGSEDVNSEEINSEDSDSKDVNPEDSDAGVSDTKQDPVEEEAYPVLHGAAGILNPLYELYFEKHYTEEEIFDGRWDVYIAEGNSSATVSADTVDSKYTCSQNAAAIYLGTVGKSNIEGATSDKQYIDITDISFDIVIDTQEYHMYAGLYYDCENEEFSLILPDVAGMDADNHTDENDDYFVVEQVVVEKILFDENERYVRGIAGIFERKEKSDEAGEYEYQVIDMYAKDVEDWFQDKKN